MTVYSPTGEYPRIFPNFQNCASCEKYLKDNKDNCRIFVPGHYLFLVAHSSPLASLSENCSLLGTDNVRADKYPSIFSRQNKIYIYSTSLRKATGKYLVRVKSLSNHLMKELIQLLNTTIESQWPKLGTKCYKQLFLGGG